MGFSVQWTRLGALSFLLCMAGEVSCDCTENNTQIAGGEYKLTNKLERGSMLIYSCPEGYYPYPHMSRVCQANGQWKPRRKRFLPQRCRLVECPDPSVLEYGDVFPPQEKYFVDNETSYECYSGYTLRGSSRRVCLPNGKWSGSTPICSRDTDSACADPGIPAGASRSGTIFGIGDKVKYNCVSNMFLVGSSERECQESSWWTGTEPACYYKHTYDTPVEAVEAFGSTIKNSVGEIQFSKTGLLNIYIAVDISIEEKHFTDAKNAVAKLITKMSTFNVVPRYEILFFSVEIFEVVNILDFWDDKITPSTIIASVKNFDIHEKRDQSKDLNRVFRTFLERMEMIKRRDGESKFEDHRHILLVFSDGAYNMGGSPQPTVNLIKNMVCKDSHRDECLDIYIFGIGAQIFDEDLQQLTVGTGVRHYFRMKDLETLPESFDDVIDANKTYGLCGLHRENPRVDIHGNKRLYPWLATIIIQNEERPRKCLGSLVSPDFVLTAAHCFSFGDLPEHVTVEIDDGHGKVKSVKTFHIHPNYNLKAKVNQGVQEFFDYDVALIQLETSVHISHSVRPICIPCTQETSYALKLVGSSSCREQEEKLLQTHLERFSFLTKTSDLVNEKDVFAKLGDNRHECIRHALQAPGITTHNPEDVVTANFLCTGGLTPFRDHIACTGDGGGAVFKDFEHRTIQVAIVSWGNSNRCPTGGFVESDSTSRDFHMNLFKAVPFLKSILGNDTQDDFTSLKFLEN